MSFFMQPHERTLLSAMLWVFTLVFRRVYCDVLKDESSVFNLFSTEIMVIHVDILNPAVSWKNIMASMLIYQSRN